PTSPRGRRARILRRAHRRDRPGLARERQRDHERAAAAEPLAASLHGAAVEFDQTAHEREPDAEPALRPLELRVDLREQVEHAGEVLRLDADARILDDDL